MRKMNVKTSVVEDVAPSYHEIQDECKALKTYYDQEIEIKAYRITFISERISELERLQHLSSDKFLSSAIIINFKAPQDDDPKTYCWKTYLFSAIVTLPKIIKHQQFGTIPLLNNYLHIYKAFRCEVTISADRKIQFDITGTFFCQQNSVTSVCAHATLCMTLNNMGIQNESLIKPEDINKIIEIDHITKKFGFPKDYPVKGLTNDDIQKVLHQYGLSFILIDFFSNPNFEYNEHIYRYIESKCPVLLVFTTNGTESHIVPILGHTLNSDMWRPEAETAYSHKSRLEAYKKASDWVDHFIMHDDNFGMYFCLPVESLKRVTLPKHDPTFRAHYAVVIVPSEVTTPSWEAEWASVVVSEDLIKWGIQQNVHLDDWTRRLFSTPRYRVIRTFLVKKEDYLNSLNEPDFEGNIFQEIDKDELTKDLPSRFWLSEITIPDLYTANKTKVIDVFYGCDCEPLKDKNEIFERCLQIRFPFVLFKRLNDGSYRAIPVNVKSHYPLLTFEREQELLDW